MRGLVNLADHHSFINALTHCSQNRQDEAHYEANEQPWVTF